MAKVTWQVPLLQFGKFMIEAEEEELGVDVSSPHSLGMAYAVWAKLAAKGYDEGLKIDVDPMIGNPMPDVTGGYQESPEPTPEDIAESNEKLNEIAEQVIKDQLGATTVKPWTINPPTTTAKQWEDFDV